MRQAKNKALNNYNQIIKEMEQLTISKEQQIEYLKSKLISYEIETKRKILFERLFFIGNFIFLLGFFFIFLKFYLFGFLLMLITCIFLSYKFITFAKKSQNIVIKKDNKLEKLKTLLETKAK